MRRTPNRTRTLAPRTLGVATALGLTLLAPLAGGAQPATPAATPQAAGCSVAARPADEMLAWWFGTPGTPAATPVPAAPLADASQLPAGTPVDPAVAAQLEEAARQMIACVNAGEFARQMALFTDRLAQQFGPEPGVTEAQARDFLAAVTPVPAAEATTFVALRDARTLPDGRVGALLAVDDPTADPTRQEVLLLFRQVGGTWLIDDLVPVLVPATPTA